MLDGQPEAAHGKTGSDRRILATSAVKQQAPGVQVLIVLTVVLSACSRTAPDDVDMTGTWIGTIEVQTCTDLTARMCEANDFGRPGHHYSSELQINSDGRVQMTVFASRVGSTGGYGIPASVVRKVLDRAFAPVSTGACAP